MSESATVSPTLDPHALARALSDRTHLIAGARVASAGGGTFEILNPATMESVARGSAGDARDIDRAVAAASRAQPAWGALPPMERGRCVMRCAAGLAEHVEELARLTSLETGKAIRTESRGEASVVARAFEYFAGLASELKGETVPFDPNMLVMTVREPVGVVGAIIPWNAPLLLMALKVAPALVAGNSVVLKSSEEAPLGVLRVAELFQRWLPPGVFNVVSGDGPTAGAALAEHRDVAKLTFTGSVAAGRSVYRAAAERLVPVTLELGGKSPMIVCADADLDRAIDGAVVGMRFTRQGQSCSAASRIYVHEALYDAFLEGLVARVDAMKMGDPLDEETDIGAIISPRQRDTVRRYIALGEATPGARAHRCSRLPDDPRLSRGLFEQPVVFTELPADSPLVREEIFGPVTVLTPWSDFDAVIEAANDSEYGLAATVWTRDLAMALQAVTRLRAGFVQANQNLVVQPPLSYGGVKQSGLGKEASLESMLEHYTHKKTILVNLR